MRNGEKRRLNRPIVVTPNVLNGEPVRLAVDHYYSFAEGLEVTIEHDHVMRCPDGSLIDIGHDGEIPEHVLMVRVVTADDRTIAVWRYELSDA